MADKKHADAKQADDEKPQPKGEIADDIKGAVTALKGDLTKLAGGKAEKTIGHFESLLEHVGPGVKSIHTDLGKLREHVTASDPDGKAIAKLLSSLSDKTAKVAEDQGGVIGTALKSLSSALEHASTSLTDGGKDDDATDKRRTADKDDDDTKGAAHKKSSK